jgi:ABC-type polysaccharide/polyol phosphate export permease
MGHSGCKRPRRYDICPHFRPAIAEGALSFAIRRNSDLERTIAFMAEIGQFSRNEQISKSAGPDLEQALEWPPAPSGQAEAFSDVVRGFRKNWLWTEWAKQDIKMRYRGSILGPFWVAISTIVMISAMGFLYSKLFHTDVGSYFPFLTIGLIVWNFVASVITEGCGTFTSVQSLIQQVPMPYSVHAYRLVLRNLLVMAHSCLIIPIVLLFFRTTSIDWQVITVVPAVTIIALNGVWIAILFGMLSARFRDIPPIVGSFVQVIFFVTPVFWSADALGDWKSVGEMNPLFAEIDVIRAPLLGLPIAPHSWTILLTMTLVGSIGTFLVFARFRSRIAFWV